MIEIGDTETSKLFEIGSDRINLRYLEDLGKLEKNSQQGRSTFLGPIYSSANWELVQMHLAPLIKERRQSKADVGQTPFVWVAPSDPFWGKSSSLQVRFAEILNNAHTKEKRIYSPAMTSNYFFYLLYIYSVISFKNIIPVSNPTINKVIKLISIYSISIKFKITGRSL